jgi:hypothetical protein
MPQCVTTIHNSLKKSVRCLLQKVSVLRRSCQQELHDLHLMRSFISVILIYISVFINVNGYKNLWPRNLLTHCRITRYTRTFRTVCIELQKTLHCWWGTRPCSEGGSLMCLVGWSNSQVPFSCTAQLTPLNTHEYGVSFIYDGNWELGLLLPAGWCSVPYIFKSLGSHACILSWRSYDEEGRVGCMIFRSVCL